MMGRTHLAAGVACALAVAAAGESAAATVALAVAGGAVGATLPDLDVKRGVEALVVRAIAAALVVPAAVLALRAPLAAGVPALLAAPPAVLGLAGLLAVCAGIRLSAHRGFSHSLAALAGVTASLALVWPQVAPYVAVGFASHLALDALNHRRVRLLWPAGRGFSLGLCSADGLVNRLVFSVSCLAAAILAAQSLL